MAIIDGVRIEDGKIASAAVGKGSLASDSCEGTRIAAAGGKSSQIDLVLDGTDPEYLSYRAGKWLDFNLAAAGGAAGMLSEANPLAAGGKALWILDAVLQVDTKPGAACTADAGIGSSGSASYDNLLDGVDLQLGGGTAPGGYSNRDSTDRGTNGKARQFWDSTDHLTCSVATGTITSFVGVLSVYVKLAESA